MKAILLAFGLLCAGSVFSISYASSPQWVEDETRQGVLGTVRAMVVSSDGQTLYAGGVFTSIGGTAAANVAQFDGRTWSPMGAGFNDAVWTLAVLDLGDGPALYAGGDFTMSGDTAINHVARWDGTAWQPVGTGTDGGVYALTAYPVGGVPALIAAGQFSMAGGTSAKNIAAYANDSWTPLGDGLTGAAPLYLAFARALAVYDAGSGPELYVGGFFNSPGKNIARWNGTSWAALGTGAGGVVNALVVWNDGSGERLYVGGAFTSAGNVVDATRIARWNGSAWSALAEGLRDEPVNTLTVIGQGGSAGLYAGGQFTRSGDLDTRRVARWNGTAWSALGDGIPDDACWCDPSCSCEPKPVVVYAMAFFKEGLYVAGEFSRITDCVTPVNLARWMARPSDTVAADFDWDRDVDVDDLAAFQTCATGPGLGPVSPCCTWADLNTDGHVDMIDFAMLQRCLTIPAGSIPPSGCE